MKGDLIMESGFDVLVTIIKGTFRVLGSSQIALHTFLTNMVTNHPGFMAYFVELSLIAMAIMGRLLYVRKQQRMIPPPKPEVIVSPVPTPAMLPDRTVSKELFRISLIVITILLFVALLAASR